MFGWLKKKPVPAAQPVETLDAATLQHSRMVAERYYAKRTDLSAEERERLVSEYEDTMNRGALISQRITRQLAEHDREEARWKAEAAKYPDDNGGHGESIVDTAVDLFNKHPFVAGVLISKLMDKR